jgi:hypothetical protein
VGAPLLVATLALALTHGVTCADTGVAQRPFDAASPPPPAWRTGSQVPADVAAAAWSRSPQAAPADAGPPPPAASWHALARGTLLHTQLNDDAQLTLRLRGGKLGLYLAVRLPGR